MADQRNFRSSYFEKVGIKGVDEKKTIDLLLSEKPYDIEKLKQFCLRFPVPIRHRLEIWKLLLDIVPPYQQAHEFVMKQRTEQYNDLRDAVFAMGKVKQNTPLPAIFLQMLLVQRGLMPFDEEKMMTDGSSTIFMAMASAVLETVEDHQKVEAYWIAHKFFLLQQKHSGDRQLLVEKVQQYLLKEDPDGTLSAHLTGLGAWKIVPFKTWMTSCFAGILPGNSYERVWDKVLGGSTYTILVFVTVAMLLTFRHLLVRIKTPADITKVITKMDEDSAESIVSKALELFQKYGAVS